MTPTRLMSHSHTNIPPSTAPIFPNATHQHQPIIQLVLTMTFEVRNQEKLDEILDKDPKVSVYLEPIAAPVVLGLAGFAGSTWIVSMWLAKWWGDVYSESTWFPLTLFFGGLGQFIAGFFGFHARDLLVNVVHILWGSFWISSALLFLLEVCAVLGCWLGI